MSRETTDLTDDPRHNLVIPEPETPEDLEDLALGEVFQVFVFFRQVGEVVSVTAHVDLPDGYVRRFVSFRLRNLYSRFLPSPEGEAGWCGREDSNFHGLPHSDLNAARLPIPPRPLASERG